MLSLMKICIDEITYIRKYQTFRSKTACCFLKGFTLPFFLSDSKTVRLPPLKNSISDDMNAFCTPWKEIPCERALSNSHIRLSKRLCNRVLFRRFQREFFPCHLPKKMEKLLFTLHPGGISSIFKERELPGRGKVPVFPSEDPAF